MAGEVYTPQPESGASPGISRPLLVGVGREFFDRSATVHRTMRYGASPNEGFVSTFLGLRQTKDEMAAFGGHKSNFFGSNWRKKAYRNAPGDIGKRGALLGTKYAPSSWLMSIDLAENPMKYNETVRNIAEGRPMYGARRAVMGLENDAELVQHYGASRVRNMGGLEYAPESKSLTRATAADAMNHFLGIGAAKSSSVGRDLMLGSMFKPQMVRGQTMPISGFMKQGSKFLYSGDGLLSQTLRSGAQIASGGGKAIGGATSAGLAMRGAWMAGGLALRYFMYYDLARMAGKTAYKGWEAYNIKAPLAAYSMVGKQLLRPSFASGDASLLTGVPANNRMRAVQAIQGSRMNARNALGGEAALLAGHFG